MRLPLVQHAAQVHTTDRAALHIGAHLCDLFHFSPFSYGHWILLQRDNVPSPNHLPELLGRAPTEVG
jgi:hypothetical protein